MCCHVTASHITEDLAVSCTDHVYVIVCNACMIIVAITPLVDLGVKVELISGSIESGCGGDGAENPLSDHLTHLTLENLGLVLER